MRRPHAITLAAAFAAFALLAGGCTDKSAAGESCSSPFSCASGLCIVDAAGAGRCAQRCALSSECARGQVCGRFDFRGRDDAGALAGSDDDIVRVCRPGLNTTCAGACALSNEVCVGGDAGVCSPTCAVADTCGGRDCIALSADACGPRACAPPCDALTECPPAWTCDLSRVDLLGHGQCIPIAGDPDAGVQPPCDAGDPGDGG
ncbi:MAG: hypothetical protein R3A52_04725 [Polyangiales bacterium]